MSEKNLNTNGEPLEVPANESNGLRDLKNALEFVKKSIKTAVPVSISLGSMVTLLYCLRIGYLPIDGLQSVATLGAAVAFTAAIFLLFFILLLAVPFGITHWGLNGEVKEILAAWFFVPTGPDGNKEGMPKEASTLLQRSWLRRNLLSTKFKILVGTSKTDDHRYLSGIKVLALMISVGSASWLMLLFASTASDPSYMLTFDTPWLVYLFLFDVLVILSYILNGVDPEHPWRDPCVRILGVIVWSGANIYALLPVVLWPSFAGLELDKPLLQFAYIALAGLVLWCFYGFHLAIQLNPKEKKEPPWTITLIFVSLLALMVLPAILLTPSFHDWLMSRTSVRMADAQLALKPEACATLRASGIPVAKSLSAEKADDEVVGCLLKEATVLLRIGERWQVSICEITGANGVLRKFTLPSDQVASWTQLPATKGSTPKLIAAKKMCAL
ncbi:MAG: hypothetical protein GZ093_07890 [Rhodoferax sp.]|uniref:hypothetical protein n=1 Tax=Rhodoferax sp. TaxID=50421 RepID=UPI0014008C0A|nr:hypothetical protein [Rhodoferax sp.]NDP38659.1 hypothetical protein [Rhodoferax sp.]